MANVTVTILQSGRCDDWGRPFVVGGSYSVEFNEARGLWQAGFASVADPTIFDDDNTPNDGGLVRYMRFPGFKKSLLASLVANSTASRANGLVTVTATAHGITTGATYQGFRVFYPGSSNLAAGWYDSIVSIPDANTLTFSAPGPDFASESVNGAVAYTTLTAFASITIPGGTIKVGSRIVSRILRNGDTTATTKNVRMLIGAFNMGLSAASTAPAIYSAIAAGVVSPEKTLSYAASDDNVAISSATTSSDWNVDQTISLAANLSAAAAFVTLEVASLEIS